VTVVHVDVNRVRHARTEQGWMVTAIPDSDVSVIRDADHHAELKAPGLLADALSALLARLEHSRGA